MRHVWGQKRDSHRVLMGKYERNRPHVRRRRKLEYNIKIDVE